jgi:hypothetical protein
MVSSWAESAPMKKVYKASSLAEAHMVVHALGDHGVPSTVRGEADPLEPPSVWVERDEDYDRALSVMAAIDVGERPPAEPTRPAARRRRNVAAPILTVCLCVSLYFNLRRPDPPQADPTAFDSNGDGRADTWAEYDRDRLVHSFDTNFDGRRDEWTFHDASGAPERRELDLDRDGRVDGWEHFQDGLIARGEYDNDGDGKLDEWTEYRFSQPVERAWSFGNDGVVDKKALYRNGRKFRERYDRDRDGSFEETIDYDAHERVIARSGASRPE